MATAIAGSTPKHLWLVGILSLVWNAVGAVDYTMTETGNVAYLESMGFGPAELAWVNAFPAWAVAAWAIGVWGSVLAAILLLLRSRHAPAVYVVSFVGAVVAFAYQFTSENRPASMEGGGAMIIPIVILILIVAQWYYARRMAAAGVLR